VRALLLVAVVLAADTTGLFAYAQNLANGISRMATDGRGRIYGFYRLWNDKLIVFENGRWRELPVMPAGKPSEPRGILGLHDGRMASVWNTGKNEWILAILDDKQISQRIPFEWRLGDYDSLSMVQDSSGRIWLSGGSPEVVRFDLPAGTFHTFDLTPLQTSDPKEKSGDIFLNERTFRPFKPEKKGPKKMWSDVFFTEDLRGGLWLWSTSRGDNYAALPGPVRVQGETLSVLADIPGLTGYTVDYLLPRDKDSLWINAHFGGLFVFNLKTLIAEPVPEPQATAFRESFHGIFPFGKKGFLVVSEYNSGFALWEFAKGKWTRRKVSDSLPPMVGYGSTPAYLNAKSGALIGIADGLLYVPHDEKGTKLLDWRRGWRLIKPSHFISLGSDRFAALSSGGGTRWAVADLNEFLAPRALSDAVEILPWFGWTVDSQDRIFTLLKPKSSVLDVWENGLWRKIPLPKDLRNDIPSHIEIDSRNRIWVISTESKLPVGILSSDLKKWELAPDYLTALAKHCDDFGGFNNPQSGLRPIPGPHGQVALRTAERQIVHWDRTVWKTWDLSTIGSFAKDDRVGSPFFDDGGQLCVNTLRSDKTWKLGGDQKWTGEPKMSGIPDRALEEAQSPARREPPKALPKDFTPQDIISPTIATDNLGVTWVAGNGNLYKYCKGRTVALFAGKEVHPFLKNPGILSVRVDRFGNTWLQTGLIDHIMLPAKTRSLPTLSVKTDRWGLARLNSPPRTAIDWRLDGGEWRTLKGGGEIVGFLSPGDHEIEFQILTDRLDLIGPISKKISVAIASSAQIDHLISILRDGPGGMREMAVRGLAAQPALAIPALKSAIAGNDFWWLRAALQECERQSMPSP